MSPALPLSHPSLSATDPFDLVRVQARAEEAGRARHGHVLVRGAGGIQFLCAYMGGNVSQPPPAVLPIA